MIVPSSFNNRTILLLQGDFPSLRSLVMLPLMFPAIREQIRLNLWLRNCNIRTLRHQSVRFLDHAAYQLRLLWNRLSHMTRREAFDFVRSSARAAIDYVVKHLSAPVVMYHAISCMLQICVVDTDVAADVCDLQCCLLLILATMQGSNPCVWLFKQSFCSAFRLRCSIVTALSCDGHVTYLCSSMMASWFLSGC